MLEVAFAQVSKYLGAARLLTQHVVVPFRAALRERLAEIIAIRAFTLEYPALIDHVDSGGLRHEED